MLKRILGFALVNTIAIFLADQFLEAVMISGSLLAYPLIGIILGILNLFVKPLLQILSLPLLFLTAGLFSIVINVALLYGAVFIISILSIPDLTFTITGTVAYLLAAFVIGFFNYLTQKLFR